VAGRACRTRNRPPGKERLAIAEERRIRPERLRPGDRVTLVSPSSPVASLVPRRLARALANLEAMGYRPALARHATARRGHTAGTVAERLEDLHQAFADPEVRMVLCTIGGFNAHQLLEDLDYDLIRRHPKIFLGYSDITALHVAIGGRTGLVTFLGPAALPQFGEVGGLYPLTRDVFQRVLAEPTAPYTFPAAEEVVAERLRWDVEDTRPRRSERAAPAVALVPGVAEGRIVAGNLGTLLLLAGTPYWPELDGALLLVEEDEDESPATLDRYFTQLRHMGVYDRIVGLGVGRMPPEVGLGPDDPLADIVRYAIRGHRFPVALDLDFGHLDPLWTIPLGVRARLEAGPGGVRLTLLEAAVR
jgi:muramoyltetrapeptide carboxypeptidase